MDRPEDVHSIDVLPTFFPPQNKSQKGVGNVTRFLLLKRKTEEAGSMGGKNGSDNGGADATLLDRMLDEDLAAINTVEAISFLQTYSTSKAKDSILADIRELSLAKQEGSRVVLVL